MAPHAESHSSGPITDQSNLHLIPEMLSWLGRPQPCPLGHLSSPWHNEALEQLLPAPPPTFEDSIIVVTPVIHGKVPVARGLRGAARRTLQPKTGQGSALYSKVSLEARVWF